MDRIRSESLAILKETPIILKEQVGTLSNALLDFRPEAGAWTIREILAHLVNNEMLVMRTRVERMLKEERPDLYLHDEQDWYAHRNTARDGIAELISDFAIQRAASLGIFASMQEEEWEREGLHAEYGSFTIAGWLERWVGHDLAHLRQIEQNQADYRK